MFSISNFITAPKAGLAVRRKAPVARRGSFRVVAHGGVGGSGGPQYPGKDKPFGSQEAPWRKKLILDDPDQADPENAGRSGGKPWTPPAPTPASSSSSWDTPLRAPAFQRFVGICPRAPTSRPVRRRGWLLRPLRCSRLPGPPPRDRRPRQHRPRKFGPQRRSGLDPAPATPTPSTPTASAPAPPPPAPSGGAGDFSVPSGAPGYQARRREIVDPDNIDPDN